MRFTDKPWAEASGASVVFNTEAAYFFLRDPVYREHVLRSDWLYCDGFGLQKYLEWRTGKPVPRKHGPDLFHDYMLEVEGRRVLLFGGTPEAQAGLRECYPDFFTRNTVTCDTTFLKEAGDVSFARELVSRNSYDDIAIFLGLRRQEAFQEALRQAGFMGRTIGLGAAIDFLSGKKARAGRTWQRLGLEWLPRMIREPRMIPRVLRSFALFGLSGRSENAAIARAVDAMERIG